MTLSIESVIQANKTFIAFHLSGVPQFDWRWGCLFTCACLSWKAVGGCFVVGVFFFFFFLLATLLSCKQKTILTERLVLSQQGGRQQTPSRSYLLPGHSAWCLLLGSSCEDEPQTHAHTHNNNSVFLFHYCRSSDFLKIRLILETKTFNQEVSSTWMNPWRCYMKAFQCQD